MTERMLSPSKAGIFKWHTLSIEKNVLLEYIFIGILFHIQKQGMCIFMLDKNKWGEDQLLLQIYTKVKFISESLLCVFIFLKATSIGLPWRNNKKISWECKRWKWKAVYLLLMNNKVFIKFHLSLFETKNYLKWFLKVYFLNGCFDN